MTRWLKRFRLLSLVRRGRVERELDEEFNYHFERQVEESTAAGLDPDEARYAALRAMGAIAQSREECRDARGVNFIENIGRNLRYGLRTLRKSPGFTIIAIFTLALGIGVNTALFSVIDVVLLRPLPFDNPDRLVVVFARNTAQAADSNVLRGTAGAQESGLSIADLEDFREQSQAFSGFAVTSGFAANLTGLGDPQRIAGVSVSPNFFSLLGVAPVLGRDFSSNEDALAGERAAILSYGFWQRRWGGDRDVLGKTVLLDQAPYTIVGVAPDGFRTPHGNAPELYRAVIPRQRATERGRRFWSTVGRMKSRDVGSARAELTTIAGRLAAQYPATNRGFTVTVTPLGQLIPHRIRSGLIVLMAAAALVLLIACSNIANLLLVRVTGREREIAIRQALGARKSQLVQQFLTENLLMAIVGGALGLLVAHWGLQILAGAAPAEIPRISQSRIDWRVLSFTSALTLLTGLFFSLVPVARSARGDWNTSLQRRGRSGGADVKTFKLSNALVVIQISLAVVLLIESGLMMRSFLKLQAVEPGFRGEEVITFHVPMSRAQFRGTEHSAALFAQLTESIGSVPGVESLGATLQLPIAGLDVDMTQIALTGRPVSREQEPSVRLHVVTPGFFSTMKIPLIRGRYFTDADGRDAPGAAIVNEAMARKLWGGDDPIGQRISQRLLLTPGEKPERAIVGVVGNVKHFGLEFTDEAQMYVPHAQSAWPAMYFVVRSGQSMSSLAKGLKEAVWSVDRSLPVEKLRTMESVLAQSTYQPRFRTFLIAVFGATAILLAAIGIYGVVSYRVAHRRREIAIRLAMGAEHAQILRLIVTDGMKLALFGAAIGCTTAMMAAPAVANLLYGVSPTDLSTMASAAGISVGAALLACFLPARRAAKVDPLVTLRLE